MNSRVQDLYWFGLAVITLISFYLGIRAKKIPKSNFWILLLVWTIVFVLRMFFAK